MQWQQQTWATFSHLIAVVSTAATAFDQEHNNDKNYITSAANHAGDFILWTWGVGAQCITIFDLTGSDLERFKIDWHQACINPSGRVTWAAIPNGLPPPPAVDPSSMTVLGLLETTISCQANKQEEQNKILTKQFEHMIKKDGTSKNQIKHFHDSTIQMLHFASALDNNEIPDKPVKSCNGSPC
jgi:hypothetical protein